MASFQGDFQSRAAIDVNSGGVTVWIGEKKSNDVRVAMFRGTHQRSAAVLVLYVYRGAGIQKQPSHVSASVRDRQH